MVEEQNFIKVRTRRIDNNCHYLKGNFILYLFIDLLGSALFKMKILRANYYLYNYTRLESMMIAIVNIIDLFVGGSNCYIC